MKMEEKLFSIEEVSRQVKIPKHTLRFWEKEFEGILVPSRTDGGQRRYTSENIARIEEIDRLRKNGKGLSEIKEKLTINGKGDLTHSDRIDLLANRVAEVVKTEICHFFDTQSKSRLLD